MPGVMGQLEKQYTSSRLVRGKRNKTEFLLYELKRLLGLD